MKIALIIPAYNEEKRITATLETYYRFFKQQPHYTFEYIIALNGCTDNTAHIVTQLRKTYPELTLIDLPQAGKGRAIKAGFAQALASDAQLIGFVDADMATTPDIFLQLIASLDDADGVIASRYMPGAQLDFPRPRIKRWGSKLVYEPLVRLLLGLSYYDMQCGAKLFKRTVIETVVWQLHQKQWAFDAELLYLCKRHNYIIKEVPTVWHDRSGSKLRIFGQGLRMLSSVLVIRLRHSRLSFLLFSSE